MPALRRATALVGGLSLLTGGLAAVTAAPATAVADPDSTVFINEIHYDNDGTDAGESIEIAAPAGTDLTGWTLVPYNGNGGTTYSPQRALTGTLDDDTASGYGFQTVAIVLQNGPPDGVALVDAEGDVVQFLSYEGSFTGVGGPADGLTSTDIGVAQTGSDAAGLSLQLTGTGDTYGDFSWAGPAAQTPGAVNNDQIFAVSGEPRQPVIDCEETVQAAAGTGATSEVSASDVDSGIANLAITSTPVDGITLEGSTAPVAAGETATATLTVDGATAVGTHEVEITATTDDDQRATCVVSVVVSEPLEATRISTIQGSGAASPFDGQKVRTRGVVTAAYPTGGFYGFVIQTPGTAAGTDATPGASDALWVHQTSGGVTAEIGQHVEVTGVVAERYGRTELSYDPSAGALTVLNGSVAPVVALATIYWPTESEREAHESELLDLSGESFTVTDNYSTNQYGEVGLATGGRPLITPTEVANPTLDAPGYQAVVADNFARGVVLDDGASTDYIRNETAQDTPLPWISKEITARVGASATLTDPVVLDYGFGKWRLQPTTQVTGVQPDLVTFEDTRPDNTSPEDVGGDLRIATFNVLNYFNTTGEVWVSSGRGTCSFYEDRDGDKVTNDRCNPNGPRGAAEGEDLTRQQDKIVAAINELDAAVVSLEEIENSLALGETDRDDALAELTGALNAAAGEERWSFVRSPEQLPASEDVIRTAFIYDPSVVALEGESVIFDGPAFSNARQPLAQAFRPVGTTEAVDAFAVVANHFKSKGSACDGEPEGPQGNCNQSRIEQARALAGFADGFAADRGLEQVFLAGDFNSYSEEDPMLVLERAGYTGLDSDTPEEWSYSYDGMSGSLDHVLANDAALAQVTGVDIWEINANEALAFEYSRFNYNVTPFYEANVFRASDHNPELVGVDVRDASDVSLALSPEQIKQKKETSTATVTVTGVDDEATGTVRFYVDGVAIGQRALLEGTAEIRVGPFEKGTYEVTADYLGDDDNLPGTGTGTLLVGNG